jgi:hypothetical protein
MLICVCSAVAGSSVQARRHDCLADGDVGHSDQFSEHRRGGGMDLGCSMGCEGGIVGVDLVVQNASGSPADR